MNLFISNLLCLISNLIVFFSELSSNLDSESLDNIVNCVIGFACLCCWINMLYVLSLFEKFNVVSKTLSNSAESIFMFTIGISPIILAFMFSAYSMFHESDRFSSFRNTFLDLVVLIAGDEYQDNYKDTADFSLSGVYFTLYGLVMLIVTANIFTFLVVAGYEQEVRDSAKRQLMREERQKVECKN